MSRRTLESLVPSEAGKGRTSASILTSTAEKPEPTPSLQWKICVFWAPDPNRSYATAFQKCTCWATQTPNKILCMRFS